MKLFNSKILGLVILGLSISAFGVYAQTLPKFSNIFSSRQISVSGTATPTPITWNISDKIAEAKQMLQGATPGVFGDPITYTEQRFTTGKDGTLNSHDKQLKEPEKEIALAVLNTATGEVKTFFIRKKGADLIAPPGWQIEVMQRPSGIRWNGWNTAYVIDSPSNYVVIGNVYPDEHDTKVAKKVKGKTTYITQRTVDYHLYVPYSPDLHSTGLAQLGEAYTKDAVAKAFADLKTAGVMSKAVAGTTVADLFYPHADYFQRIPLLEQTDLTEFMLDPIHTIERAEVIIGANGKDAFNATCNASSACGWLQFTPGTYTSMVKSYPSAQLIPDFKTGAADHVNSMKAAILLYDTNLKSLIASSNPSVLNDPNLEEYLASSYNGAPRHVYTTLKAAIIGGIQDWITALTSKNGGLKDETKGYLVKLRWLKQNNIPALTLK